MFSPMPHMSAGRAPRHTGTSAPSSRRDVEPGHIAQRSRYWPAARRAAVPPRRPIRRRGRRQPAGSSRVRPTQARASVRPGAARRAPGRAGSRRRCSVRRVRRPRRCRRAGLQRHHVVQVGKRHQAFELMIAVGAPAEHVERQIDFRVRALTDRHGGAWSGRWPARDLTAAPASLEERERGIDLGALLGPVRTLHLLVAF